MAFAKKQLKSSICLLLGLQWAFGGGILGGCASSLPVSSEYILSSATAVHLSSDILREKKLFINDQFKRIQNLWVFV